MPTPDNRTPAEHDCDRILYSDELRRLGGVTQVVAVGETPLFHTRLTHTLKVQQLARRLAEHLDRDSAQAEQLEAIGGVDVAAAEAAGLAHDLGHPPFGHVGEEELNERCRHYGLDGFEGNAQTFRILAKLATHPAVARGQGLGLSPRTLCAVIKYPELRVGQHEHNKKWNAYPTEHGEFTAAREALGLGAGERSLEAAIMDWADDVTYAFHDLEDFIRARHVPITALIWNEDERNAFVDASWSRVAKKAPTADRKAVVDRFLGLLKLAGFGTAYRERDWLHSRDILDGCRYLIHEYVSRAELGERPEPLVIPETVRAEVELFKQLTWYYVIFDPRLASLQLGQQTIIRELFDSLHRWLKKADQDKILQRVPHRLRWALELTYLETESRYYASRDDARYARAVADFIASLTEGQTIDLHRRVASSTGQSVLDPWMVY